MEEEVKKDDKFTVSVIRDNKNFIFVCDNDSSLGQAFDAVTQIRNFIIEKINESAKDPVVEPEPKQEVEDGGCCIN